MNKKKLSHDWFYLHTREHDGMVCVVDETDPSGYLLSPTEFKWIARMNFDPEFLAKQTSGATHHYWAEAIPMIFNVVVEKRQLWAAMGLK